MRPPILIIGNGRSGTNWLMANLNASPETFCRNEPQGIATSPFQALVGHCSSTRSSELEEHWQHFLEWSARHYGERDARHGCAKAYLHPLAFSTGLADLPLRPRARAALKWIWPPLRRSEWPMPFWIGSPRRLGQARLVLKINDMPARLVEWVMDHHPEVPLLHIVRAPGGQLNSGLRRFFNHLDEGQRAAEERLYKDELIASQQQSDHWRRVVPDVENLDLVEAVAWFWRVHNESIWEAAQARRHASYLRIVYERLISDFDTLLPEVFRFCSLELDPDTEKRARASRTGSHRGRTGTSSDSLATKWKTELDDRTKQISLDVLKGSPMADWWREESQQ